jgi:hypothetical protein
MPNGNFGFKFSMLGEKNNSKGPVANDDKIKV